MMESSTFPMFFVSLCILLHIPIVFYLSQGFLVAIFLIGVVGLFVDLHPRKLLRKLFHQPGQYPSARFKWANKRYYAFLCDPKKRYPSNCQLKFSCPQSQKEVESPPSAVLIAVTNPGFEFDETRRGWRNIKVSGNDKKFDKACWVFKKLTDRVQGAYFDLNGVSYPAGCSLTLGSSLSQEDREIFLEFSKNQKFSNFLTRDQRIPRVLDFRESDLIVLYATRFQEDFVIFAKNLKSSKIERFIFDNKRWGFERIHVDLDFDESKVLIDDKRRLLFMTYGESGGKVETLTVYRTADGRLEKKVLDDGRFRVIEEREILERSGDSEYNEDEEEEEEEFEIVTMPDENDVYEF